MSEKSLHEINSRKHERKAALLTFLCSSGMGVLCFLITAFTIQDPPPGEQYVAVDFAEIGEVEDAGGVTETEVPSEVVEEVVEEQEAVESIQEQVQAEEVVTQEESEDAIQEVVEEVEEEEPTVEEPERESQGANLISQFAASGGGGSQGDSEGVGNQGAEDGRIEGTGVVTGDFFEASLGDGAKMVEGPVLDETPSKEGNVRVRIIVDSKGNVIDAKPDAADQFTNTRYSELYELAIKAAKSTKWAESSIPRRKGYINFRFELE